jgi:PPOX class probable F420-dependent enzyme
MGTNRRAEIKMTDEEVHAFLQDQKTATMATMHPDGSIHAVAMWYGFLDGVLTVETKAKSQKIRNLQRDPRVTFLVEAGERYEELRGVEIVGTAKIIDDPDAIWQLGMSVWERYIGPYDETHRDALQAMLAKRVLVTPQVTKMVSWDHRKLA